METHDAIKKLKDLDVKFIENKVVIIREFVKSKIEYWKQIPRLHLIYGREDERFDTIVKNKVYPIDSYFFDRDPGFCCVDCKNATIVYFNKKLNSYVNIELDKSVKRQLAFSINDSILESLNGERIYNEYTQNNKSRSIEINDSAIELWLMRAIINEISITLDDFRMHFNNDFGYDKESFAILYDNCTAKLAGKILTY